MSAPTVDETTHLDPELADDLQPECDHCPCPAVWAWTGLGPCACRTVGLLCQHHHDFYSRALDAPGTIAICSTCHTEVTPWRQWTRIERI